MAFTDTVNRIKNGIRRGDICEICRSAGFLTTNSYYKAIKRQDWTELTKGEEKIINAAIAFIEERNRRRENTSLP